MTEMNLINLESDWNEIDGIKKLIFQDLTP